MAEHNIPEIISKARLELGLGQTELGKRLGVTRQTVWGWETGNSAPSPAVLRPLARVLRVPLHSLIPRA